MRRHCSIKPLDVRRESRTVDGGLTGQLLEHLCGTGQSVTRLADGDVQDELVDAQLTHGVGALVIAFRHLDCFRSASGGFNEEDRESGVVGDR